MDIDIGNAMDTVATPGLDEATLGALDERVTAAHERIRKGMAEEAEGYAALRLPETTDPGAIREAVATCRDCRDVLLVGIGGSALGAATMATALGSDDRLAVLDNVDPWQVDRELAARSLEETAVFIVSRSGTTAETMANAAVVTAAFERVGIDWLERTVIVTGEDGPLREVADEHSVVTLPTPAGVPGRYSALSTMGLPVVAALGHDIEAILAGGREAIDSLGPSLFESPSYAFGAVSYALAQEGALVNAMMPYAERLEPFAEWFAQLWAESLGKDGRGQIPARALGATDQHSQLQLYRAGPPRIQTSFLAVDATTTVTIPGDGPIDPGAGLGDRSLGELLASERAATEASLAEAGRPNVRLEIDALDERAVGDLLVSMEAACIMAGELFGVDPFTQPAVEWGKRATRDVLAGRNTPEAETVRDKHERRIESE